MGFVFCLTGFFTFCALGFFFGLLGFHFGLVGFAFGLQCFFTFCALGFFFGSLGFHFCLVGFVLGLDFFFGFTCRREDFRLCRRFYLELVLVEFDLVQEFFASFLSFVAHLFEVALVVSRDFRNDALGVSRNVALGRCCCKKGESGKGKNCEEF